MGSSNLVYTSGVGLQTNFALNPNRARFVPVGLRSVLAVARADVGADEGLEGVFDEVMR
jgi:hypothetical protein